MNRARLNDRRRRLDRLEADRIGSAPAIFVYQPPSYAPGVTDAERDAQREKAMAEAVAQRPVPLPAPGSVRIMIPSNGRDTPESIAARRPINAGIGPSRGRP